MKFQPKSDKEIAEANLWPAGNYNFEIIEGADKISKVKPDGSGGNEMIELKLKVFNDDGAYIFINDYLLESLAFKLKHAATACGLSEQYNVGALAAVDFVGKCGKLKLKIQKDKEGKYSDKNVIGDYVVEKDSNDNASPPAGHPAAATLPDDTIPF